jgi:rubrerythrin
MEKKFNIIGKISPEERQQVSELLNKERKWQPMEGEHEKSTEEQKIIDAGRDFLKSLSQKLGIEIPILPHQAIHVLSREKFQELFPEAEAPAFYDPMDQAIYLDRDFEKENKPHALSHLIHEMIHASSFHKYYADAEHKIVTEYRIGYWIKIPSKENQEYFYDLNEAITADLTFEFYNWLTKNRPDLQKELSLEKESHAFFSDKIAELDDIIKMIAKNNNEPQENIRRRFIKGLFTGEMTHLRDIERIFGKGSLRRIAKKFKMLEH